MFLFTQAGPDGEITAEEQVQMLLNAKVQCLHIVSTDDLAGKKKNTFFFRPFKSDIAAVLDSYKSVNSNKFWNAVGCRWSKISFQNANLLLANPGGKSAK